MFARLPFRLFLVLVLVPIIALLAARGGGSGRDESQGVVVAPVEATISPAQPHPNAPTSANPPTAGRWIDVDLSHYEVQLMDGNSVLRTIGPVAVGKEVDSGNYESTQTGMFHVYVKTQDLSYDAPYDTYISDWVGFDPDLNNGFHSFLKDAKGKVVDASTGAVSNGCIRTGDATAIFDFAQIGMPVVVHL
jgi:lipoprotein-anchoring transpeptidase ErfK/SrfK